MNFKNENINNEKDKNIKEENIIKINLNHNEFLYEIEGLCRLFYPHYKIVFVNSCMNLRKNKNFIDINVDNNENHDIILNISVNINNKKDDKTLILKDNSMTIKEEKENKDKNKENENTDENKEKEIELQICIVLFQILSKITKIRPKWGVITGVRPVKLFNSLSKCYGIEYSRDYFRNRLLVSEEKINLAENVASNQDKILKLSNEKSFSLYISIPFCPSRCAYCSFVSQSVEKSMKLIPDYLVLLQEEIICTAKIVKELGLKLETVYIGGGTPTVLDFRQLDFLINSIVKNFDMDSCREFTVEAGRPDTINKEKLKVLGNYKDVRISINPQTFNDDVLKIIGRKHSSHDTLKAFQTAREMGISNINMDLIAGLPGDSFESFCNTVKQTLDINPEAITLHTLCVKRASDILQTNDNVYKNNTVVDEMLNFAYASFVKESYHPYYLYRQSKMLGNMENTGWSKKGLEGLYNIYIMEETHSIIACGAGAVTKLKNPLNGKIERIFNFKFSYEYVNRFDEIIKRKGKVKNFYEEFQ